LAKIAVELERALALRAVNGGSGFPTYRLLGQGNGWTVGDVVCTSGPQDRAFEERHSHFSIAVVAAGSFQYRSECRFGASRELMTPGSLLLGKAGQCFECGHEHGMGDRCLSFGYTPAYFEKLAADAGTKPEFPVFRLPPLRVLSSLIARACAGLEGSLDIAWEELSVKLAVQALRVAAGLSSNRNGTLSSAVARVTNTVRGDRAPS